MTMLSRVAERIYWMARYHERTQDTARLTNAFTHLRMDLPQGSEIDWDVLIKIFDAQELFLSRYRVYSEQNVLRFLIADRQQPSSIASSIALARENIRTTRAALPAEIWEYYNELYLYVTETAEDSVGRRNRYKFLDNITAQCQQIDGFLNTTLSRDYAYCFLKLGQLLERADMATRIIDIGAEAILSKSNATDTIEHLLWASLLRSLSATTSYRQYYGPLVEHEKVVGLILKESTMPRSVLFCLRQIREQLDLLENHSAVCREVDIAIDSLTQFSISNSSLTKLRRFIDTLQFQFIAINDQITKTWF